MSMTQGIVFPPEEMKKFSYAVGAYASARKMTCEQATVRCVKNWIYKAFKQLPRGEKSLISDIYDNADFCAYLLRGMAEKGKFPKVKVTKKRKYYTREIAKREIAKHRSKRMRTVSFTVTFGRVVVAWMKANFPNLGDDFKELGDKKPHGVKVKGSIKKAIGVSLLEVSSIYDYNRFGRNGKEGTNSPEENAAYLTALFEQALQRAVPNVIHDIQKFAGMR